MNLVVQLQFIIKVSDNMINLKTPLAYELANLLYDEIIEKGELDLNCEYEIFELKAEYGLRRVSSGAIQILQEREDLERIKDENGRLTLKFKVVEKWR